MDEIEVKSLEDWVNEGITYPKTDLSHKEWVEQAKNVKRYRVKKLSDLLDRCEASIMRYVKGDVPSPEVRKAIAEVIGEPILWKVENRFIVTKPD